MCVRLFLITSISIFFLSSITAQLGYGFTSRLELYSRYVNPKDDIASPSSGSAIVNLGFGPKLWLGAEKYSVSIEGTAVFSPFALSVKDFKGLGALSFPVLARLNLGGLSALNKEGKPGFSVGLGYQWTRTELYGLRNKYEDLGVSRNYFRNLVAELGVGYGMGGFAGQLFIRYGRDGDARSNVFSIGLIYDHNAPKLKKTTDPDF